MADFYSRKLQAQAYDDVGRRKKMQFRDKVNIGFPSHPGFAVLLLLSLFIAAGSAWKASEAGTDMHAVLAGPLEAERLVSDWSGNITGNMKRTTVLVESRDPALVSQFAAEIAASSKRNTELMKKVEGLLDTEQEKVLFAKIEENRKAYHSTRDTVFKLIAEGRGKDAYKALEAQYMSVARRYQEMVAQFVQLERRQLNDEAQQAAQTEASGRMAMIVLAALALLLGVCLAWRLVREAMPSTVMHSANQAPPQAAGRVDSHSDRSRNWDEFYDILA